MKTGVLLALGLTLFTTAHARNLTFQDIMALAEEESPSKAALTQDPAALMPAVRSTSDARSDWGYSGDVAPEQWHTLHTDYAACAGNNQSPVNISASLDTDLAPLEFHYDAHVQTVVNDGKSVQFTYPVSKHIVADGERYYLRKIKMHTPSENRINGTAYPLETHLIHESVDGKIAVVAVMASVGADNAGFKSLLQAVPSESGETTQLAKLIEPIDVLPTNRDYYRFNGSLTTPPCTEGVRWFVLKDAIAISTAQLQTVAGALGQANNRPVQPLNARLVLH